MQKNPLVLFVIALCGIALIGSFILWITKARENAGQKVDQTSQQNIPKLEVATDPGFPEVKGQVISGFPDFPVYPGATLVASAKTNRADQPDTGYRVKWEAQDSVIPVMNWYQDELSKNGWTYEVPNDPDATGEQVAQIKKAGWEGFVESELEDGATEIVVEVRITK